jgi:hypothetical protein
LRRAHRPRAEQANGVVTGHEIAHAAAVQADRGLLRPAGGPQGETDIRLRRPQVRKREIDQPAAVPMAESVDHH